MRLIILVLLFWPLSAFSITEKDVVRSSLQYFPQVLESLQKLKETEGKVTEARGGFDAKIKAEVDSRTQGYYDGDAYKASLEKPLPFLGSKIYAGHRQGFGQFPVYEGKYETLNRGESFAGVSLSLLRDSFIDETRYKLFSSEQEVQQAQFNFYQAKVKVQTMALKAYWLWLVKGHELQVYENILKLAKARDKQINRRIKVGDLAKIYAAENKQYVRKREAQVLQSQLEFQEASYHLSLFYRDGKGRPTPIGKGDLPPIEERKLGTLKDTEATYQKALQDNLKLKILESEKKQAQLDIRMGRNEFLPRADLNFEWNQDQGIGPDRLTQDENRILLTVEVPLQFRKASGKKRAGEAKLDQVKTKKRWVQEKLKADLRSLIFEFNSLAKIYEITIDQIKLAERLAKAEQKKFSKGASDLILVNLREENFAEAQVKNLYSLLKYYFIDADIKDLRVDLIVDK